MQTIVKAFQYALERYGAVKKDSSTPYIVHPAFPLSIIHTMISYLDMMIIPEYAKTRTDAKAIEGGGLIKKS